MAAVRKKYKRRRKKSGLPEITLNRIIVAAAALAAVVILAFVLFSGCGVSHKSDHAVVHSLIEAYGKGRESQILECYGQKKNPEESLQAEVTARLAYFEAQGMKSIEVGKIDEMGSYNDISFVYALYRLVLENEEKIPCLSTFAVRQEDGKYVVLSPGKITTETASAAAESYTKFMTTDLYKEYLKEYNTFIKKNPGFEENLTAEMGE